MDPKIGQASTGRYYEELEKILAQMKQNGFIGSQGRHVYAYEISKARPQPMDVPRGLIFKFDETFPLVGSEADSIVIDDPHALDAEVEAIAKYHDDHFWPHKNGCPVCGSDAYVGFMRVECSNGGCQNFVWKEGM